MVKSNCNSTVGTERLADDERGPIAMYHDPRQSGQAMDSATIYLVVLHVFGKFHVRPTHIQKFLKEEDVPVKLVLQHREEQVPTPTRDSLRIPADDATMRLP